MASTTSSIGDSPTYAQAISGAVYSGTLQKQGRKTGKWVARYFVLRQEPNGQGFLFYYKAKEDTEPHGTIEIDKNCSFIPKVDGDLHGFLILTPQREHNLYAANKKESSMWISALENTAAGVSMSRLTTQPRKTTNIPTIREPKTKKVSDIETLYEVHEELGSGGFATVRRGVNQETGQHVALKIIPSATYKKAKYRTDEEVMVLSACDHKNVMRLYEVVRTETSLVMCLELLTGNELFDRIVAREKYTENDAKLVASEILEAVNYLHCHGIVHRDLKPENLIFDRPGDDATLKLTDFGFATIMEPNKKLTSACGTPEYVAPEVLADKPYDQQADMWSCGVIIYILLCGYPPFYGKNEKELFEKILSRKFEFHDRFWGKISAEAKDLINTLIEPNPLKRLTSKQALQHPWIKRQIENGDENMSDVLIQLKRFNAARKFKKGVLAVLAANRFSELGDMD
jgi:serine/threonine protein kinase